VGIAKEERSFIELIIPFYNALKADKALLSIFLFNIPLVKRRGLWIWV